MKAKTERLKKLSAHGVSLEDLIRCVLSADPKPLWEQERREREKKRRRNVRNETARRSSLLA